MRIKIEAAVTLQLLTIFQLWNLIAANNVFNSDPFDRPHISGFDLSEHVPGEPFSPLDYQNAATLSDMSPPEDRYDPIELAGLFEGDIILSATNMKRNNDSESPEGLERNAIILDKQKWIGGIIPYFISGQFNAVERSVIARAFLEYHNKTCILFRPKTTEVDYIHIMKGNGCSSNVGRTGGPQAVTLGEGCVYPGIAIHELMHAVGFWHEQSRFDRDDHVNIYFNNIQPGMEFNFRKYSWKDIQNLSVPYDTASVMHYGPYAFAKDRRYATILPKNPNDRMGQRDGFSPKDIMKINRLYNCDKTAAVATTASPPPAQGSATGDSNPAPETVDPATTNTTTATNTTASRCVDQNRFCAKWSNRGECTRNPAWMSINCRMSCGRCDTPCSDVNKYCPQWAASGECDRNPDYMKSYCAKSCGSCVSTEPVSQSEGAPELTLPPCEDNNKYCETWAKDGQCQKNPKWMFQNCAKSCKACVSQAGVSIQNAINNNNN